MITKLTSYFRSNTALSRLLLVNIIVFILLKLLSICFVLFNVNFDKILTYLELPASLPVLLYRPWTLITYMFLHYSFLHLFFNMLCLYWFGKLFLDYFTQKQLTGVYVCGGIVAGFTYLLAYNVFPYFSGQITNSYLLGASGSIMAIILAVAVYAPNVELQLFLLGRIRLKWVAAAMVLISMLNTTSINAGGEFAHLGGALAGVCYVLLLKNGKDILYPFHRCMNFCVNLFKRKPKIKVTRNNYVKSDAEYNVERKQAMDDLDKILDKVKKTGYAGLTSDEKKRLFDQSQKL